MQWGRPGREARLLRLLEFSEQPLESCGGDSFWAGGITGGALPTVGGLRTLRSQMKWLLQLVQRDDARTALALVPDSVSKDAASWLSFCVRMGRAGAHRALLPAYPAPRPQRKTCEYLYAVSSSCFTVEAPVQPRCTPSARFLDRRWLRVPGSRTIKKMRGCRRCPGVGRSGVTPRHGAGAAQTW